MDNKLNLVSQRADSYKLLSQCYYLPDSALMQQIVDIAQTNSFFADLSASAPSDVEELKIDHTRLFIGPFKLLAPPYGSIYLEDNRMMGESTIDVRNRYEKEGLEIVINDVPDHIAMELEFMYYLVTKELNLIDKKDTQEIQSCLQSQQSFLQVHLSRWLPRFTENVQKNAQTIFYRKLAELTDIFVQEDLKACELVETLT